MKKVTRKDYDIFRWLPITRWNVDTLMGPELGQNIFCKVCDEYVKKSDASGHVSQHVSQRKRQIAADKKKAKEERLQKLRLAREARKEAGNQ